MIEKISKEAGLLNDIIATMGCVTIKQAEIILAAAYHKTEAQVRTISEILKVKQYIDIVDNKYLIPHMRGVIDIATIDNIWFGISTVVEEMKDANEALDAFRSFMPSDEEHSLFFLLNNKIYEIVHVEASKLSAISFAEMKFDKLKPVLMEDDGNGYVKVFLFDDAKFEQQVLEIIRKKELKLPYQLAFISASDGLNCPAFDVFDATGTLPLYGAETSPE